MSQVVQFDARQEGGCPRRWAFVKMFGKTEPETGSQTAGKLGAKQLEYYLKTGINALSPELQAGRHLLPKPGPDLEVEQDLGDKVLAVALRDMVLSGKMVGPLAGLPPHLPTDADVEEAAGLTCTGIPFIGAADVRHYRGMYVDVDGTLRAERSPETTAEVIDHKMTSRINDHVSRNKKVYRGFAKSIEEICTHPQWLGYGVHAHNRKPHLTHVRLSAIYYQTKHQKYAEKRTALLSVGEIRQRWDHYVLPIVREMVDVAASAKKPEDVPYNLASCNSFNKECPHAAYCARPAGDVFDLLQIPRAEEEMSYTDLFDDTPAPANGVNQHAPSIPATPAPAIPPQSEAERAAVVAAEKAKLLAATYGYCPSCGSGLSEQNASRLPNGSVKHLGCPKANAAEVPSSPSSSVGAVNPADGPAPNILRDAAALPREAIAAISDPELRDRATKHADAVTALSAAAEAGKPVKEKTGGRCDGGGNRVILTQAEALNRKKKCSYCGKEWKLKQEQIIIEGDSLIFVIPNHNLPKAEDAANAAPAIPQTAPPSNVPAIPSIPAIAAPVPEIPSIPSVPPAIPDPPAAGPNTAMVEQLFGREGEQRPKDWEVSFRGEKVQAAPVTTAGIVLYVDVVFARGTAPTLLDDYYLDIVRTLEKAGGVRDMRHVPDKHDLGFGRWKGALAAAVRACPPAPGEYVVHNYRTNEIVQEVVHALEPMCARVAWGGGR